MKFSEEFINIFNFLGEKLGIVIDWSNENVIPYIETLCGKILSWNITTNIFWMVLVTIIFAFAGRFAYVHCKCFDYYCGYDTESSMKCNKLIEWDDDALVFTIGVCFVIMLISFITFCCCSYDMIKTIVFPELKLFEYIQSFIN